MRDQNELTFAKFTASMLELYNRISYKASGLVTSSYSTSFSGAVRMFDRETRDAIYSIYGFVRFADEIVDTFHSFDKVSLLKKFEQDFYDGLQHGISLNPILNSFQLTVKKYNISDDLIQAFLKSMKTDLVKQNHISKDETNDYIFGSAEVVGLMCLRVFVSGDDRLYGELEGPARKLGSAFQKVNFLRDIKVDTEELKRKYFHISVENGFTEEVKNKIVDEVVSEFDEAYAGLKKLPGSSKAGVLSAYFFYRKLLEKIKKTPSEKLLEKRIRISDTVKLLLFIRSYALCKLNLLN